MDGKIWAASTQGTMLLFSFRLHIFFHTSLPALHLPSSSSLKPHVLPTSLTMLTASGLGTVFHFAVNVRRDTSVSLSMPAWQSVKKQYPAQFETQNILATVVNRSALGGRVLQTQLCRLNAHVTTETDFRSFLWSSGAPVSPVLVVDMDSLQDFAAYHSQLSDQVCPSTQILDQSTQELQTVLLQAMAPAMKLRGVKLVVVLLRPVPAQNHLLRSRTHVLKGCALRFVMQPADSQAVLDTVATWLANPHQPAYIPKPVTRNKRVSPANTLSLACLVVDDDFVNCRIAERFLQSGGHRATAVQSGAAAVELFESHLTDNMKSTFDVVLMDLNSNPAIAQMLSL
jgi:hypothetical protein